MSPTSHQHLTNISFDLPPPLTLLSRPRLVPHSFPTAASRVFSRARCPQLPMALVAQATGGWSDGSRVETSSSSGGGQRYKAVSPVDARQVWFVVRRSNDELSTDFQKESLDVTGGVLRGLKHIQSYGVVHGCIHPRNILLDTALQPVLAGCMAAQRLVSRNTTAQLRAAHLPQAPDAIVLPMVRLALSCTASDPLARPTVTDLLRSIKALKRSLSALPRPPPPGNAGASRDGDTPGAAASGRDEEHQGGEGGDGLSGGFSQNALDAKLEWLMEEEDSGRLVTDV
ncbi:unnamed protein product [Closterium sp. Yama58-4]|nr:unnamed protein product [Closterium sp. Yama58-4]